MDRVTCKIRGLEFGYGNIQVLHGIDMTFRPGRFHAIVGPNGSGKSTLLDLLSGLKEPDQGSVEINGEPVAGLYPARLACLVALVPQEFDFNFPFSVREAVLMGRHPHIPRFSRPTENDMAHVRQAMEATSTNRLADRVLAELSGGEKQRTMLARALAQDTPALLLDEPTSSMDIRHALMAMAELKRLAQEENRTIIAVLHDLNLAAGFCDHIVMLNQGRIFAQGDPIETLTTETIHDVFAVHADIITTENDLHISYGIKELP